MSIKSNDQCWENVFWVFQLMRPFYVQFLEIIWKDGTSDQEIDRIVREMLVKIPKVLAKIQLGDEFISPSSTENRRPNNWIQSEVNIIRCLMWMGCYPEKYNETYA